jgi:hypothetical protein
MPAGGVQEPEPTVVIVTGLAALAAAAPRSRPSRVRSERASTVPLSCFRVMNLIRFFIALVFKC